METLFTKIAENQIPSTKLYEDELCFVIMDINPVLKGHSLVIAKEPYPNIGTCPDSVLTHMMIIAKKVEAAQRKVLGNQGSNIIINNDPASGQEVPHIHIHVIPRYTGDRRKHFRLHEKYKEGEMQSLGEKLKLKVETES